MAIDVADWLRRLGLERYETSFRDHDVDGGVLAHLTADDLASLGVTSIGHRRKLLAAIAALEPQAASTVPTPQSKPADAERRQLTVMFCDIVDSTAISTRLDPEDFGRVLGAFQEACASAVAGFGGSVTKYMGDGALIYFGYPEAHEDDAERAIRAGLALVEAMAALPSSLPVAPQVRVGIATGLVVVGELIGEGSAQERVAVGETLNLAARIQASAPPGSVMVGGLTRRLAGAAFDYDDHGPQEFKGIGRIVRLWRVVGDSGAHGRFDSRAGIGLTPLVGRSEEIALLLRRWEQARDGEGQLILLSAPAGFGKSRMVQAFRERLDSPPVACLQYFGSPFHVNSAFYPFIRQFGRMAGFVRSDSAAQKLEKLEAALLGGPQAAADTAPLLAALLSIPFGERYPPLQINEAVQKQRTVAAIEEQLALLAARRPLLLVFEDAHWIDPTSLELMTKIIARAAELPAMIIITYRPEFMPLWLELGHVTMLKLNNLGRSLAVDLIHKAAGERLLPEAIIEQIVAKSQGVPLFVEEITRSIVESGDLEEAGEHYVLRPSSRDFAIPSTLQDSLIARLDRLGPAKDVALTASILGREFSYELLEAVVAAPQATLLEGLQRLVQSDLLAQRGVPPHSRYVFKHALIRDAAFQSILKARKRELHHRVGDVLAGRFPEVADTEPELLAYHYGEAGIVERALSYWRKAGERAAARLAFVEALGHVEAAMKLVAALPAGAERDEWELVFLVIEGPSRMALDGWDSAPARSLYEKARAVAERLGRPSEVFRSVWGLWMGAHGSGRHLRAHELYREMFDLVKQDSEPEYLVQAHHAGSSQMVWEGHPRAALGHIELLLSSYRVDVHGNLALLYGAHDPGCCSLNMRALSLMMLGHIDQALAASAKAAELSEQLDHKPSIAQTMQFRAEFLIILNRWQDAEACVDVCKALSEKFSLGNYLDYANLMQGWVGVQRGDVDAGVRQAEAALEAIRAVTSRRFHMPIRVGIVGRAKAAAGDIDGALALFDAAYDEVPITGERWYEAELLRFRAEMLLALSKTKLGEAERCLKEAIVVAQKQEAKFWELRASMALARLWAGNGRRTEAHALLAPVHGWFTEGRDSDDLKQSAALLAALE
jgi:predicted ATPase/class 3 adenylate cyclase